MQASTKQRVLLVDDEPQVLVALEDLLGEDFNIVSTASPDAALDLLQRDHDIAVIVTDQRMPHMSGDELLSKLGASSQAVRIMVTGYADLSAVIRAVNEGKIFAYVTKPWSADDLRLKVFHAVEHFKLSRELTQERQLLNSVLDSMGEGVVVADRDGKFLLFNRRAEEIIGARPQNTNAQDWASSQQWTVDAAALLPDNHPLLRAMDGSESSEIEITVRAPAAPAGVKVAVTATPLRYQDLPAAGGIMVMRDVTQERRLEEQLRQAQKMDAIGRLAGGVAHDFNNLLAVIKSYGALILEQLPPNDPKRDDLEQMLDAARRSASLTKQLLAFTRHQPVQPKALQLNDVVSNMERMLRRVIGEDVRLLTSLAPSLGSIRADTTQIEQIILNLVVNAREAMPNGGRLTIETAKVLLDEDYAADHAGVAPGSYAMLAVTDTGTGIHPDIRSRIFEPFFTTKELGKGTGLGLATVYGIVQQNGGHVWLYSELGRGTCFKLYFPLVADEQPAVSPRRVSSVSSDVAGTVLLVEDEYAVRRVAARILTSRGFTVFEADGPVEARTICDEHSGRIDLLLTDIIMPELSGPALAKELRQRCPRLRVLFMSGYAGASVFREGGLPEHAAYLEKPFTPTSLVDMVRQVLAE